jgi:hypothetical protein
MKKDNGTLEWREQQKNREITSNLTRKGYGNDVQKLCASCTIDRLAKGSALKCRSCLETNFPI